MNDDQYLLANAYLDGELTDDERRIAEADPDVMTEVELLRALQAELRDVPPPTAAAREAAVGAAMAAFRSTTGDTTRDTSRMATGGAAAGSAHRHTGARVVPFRPRPAYAKLLGVAAAFVAVAGLGIVVAQRGGDDDVPDSAAVLVDEDATERTEAQPGSVATADAAESEIMAADEAAEGGMADDEAPAEEEAVTEPADGEAADLASDTAEITGDPSVEAGVYREVPPDFDPRAPITDDVELGVLGAHLIAERDAGRLPPTPNHPCTDAQQILDETTVLLGDESVPVYVDVDETDGRVTALRTDSCAELLTGSLYP